MFIANENDSGPDTSVPVQGRRGRLTVANLALHDRNTTRASAECEIRSWLDGTGVSRRAHFDIEAWTELVEEDPVAADIEAATRGGNENEGRRV